MLAMQSACLCFILVVMKHTSRCSDGRDDTPPIFFMLVHMFVFDKYYKIEIRQLL